MCVKRTYIKDGKGFFYGLDAALKVGKVVLVGTLGILENGEIEIPQGGIGILIPLGFKKKSENGFDPAFLVW